MLPLPADIQPKDVSQWLEGGYFFAKVPGKEDPVICMLDHSSPEPGLVSVTVISNHSVKHVPVTDVFAHWPMCGAVNVHKWEKSPADYMHSYAMFLNRLQKKQWRRTYNADCLYCHTIANGIHSSPDLYPVVKAAFLPEYYSYSEALDMFKKGWKSVAITPNLIVEAGARQRVYFDSQLIGVINPDTKEFVCARGGLKRRLLPLLDYKVG